MDLSGGLFGPPENWATLADWLGKIGQRLPGPRAVLVITAHWEAVRPTVSSAAQPGMLYDYQGFPPETYRLSYPAPGSPTVARRVRDLLGDAGIVSDDNPQRGFDHGTFVPLMLIYPAANVPVVQLSLQRNLDPGIHLAIGRALQPLRKEGVLILGSGMSVHNMPGFRAPNAEHEKNAADFDRWLTDAVTDSDPQRRNEQLASWQSAPGGIASHQPTAEHLAPLFVVAGAAGADLGRRSYHEQLMGLAISGFEFGG
jgi:aromatic ring-opening dioxygenase catalytic subunit (LigB family)